MERNRVVVSCELSTMREKNDKDNINKGQKKWTGKWGGVCKL